jgi:hypothetical protein
MTTPKKRVRKAVASRVERPAVPVQEISRSSKESGNGTVTARLATAEARPMSKVDRVDWEHDYRYILGDLRQLLLVSVVLFIGMFIVGYFI